MVVWPEYLDLSACGGWQGPSSTAATDNAVFSLAA